MFITNKNTTTSLTIQIQTGSSNTDFDQSNDDLGMTEPRMPVVVGGRRRGSGVVKTAKDIPRRGSHEKDQSITINDLQRQVTSSKDRPSKHDSAPGLHRRTSSKNVKLGTNVGHQSDSSIAGNFMANIHSSPLQATAHYTAPVYPKSNKDVEFIEISLQRNFVFANALSDEETNRKREMKLIVDAFESYTVSEVGSTILSAGSVGDYFYILKEGCVEYKNRNQRGNIEVVGKAKRPGQSFGELCLLYDCLPPATCVSGPLTGGNVKCHDGSSCILWRLHKLTFRQIMAMRTIRRDEHLRDAIRKISEFSGLDDDFINRISNAMDVRTVKRGEVIYEVGEDNADEFYVVGSDGTVKITPQKGKSVVIGSGESFGTESIGSGEGMAVRNETAKAAERTTLLVMSREHLTRTIGSLNAAVQLSNDRRLLKSIPLFRDSDFEDFEYELLAALIEKVNYKGGKVVYEEEERVEEPSLMIVRNGILDQFSDQYPDREKVLKEGDIFGEDSLLPDKNMKFGGAKGGTKYREETVEVVSEVVECGKLTLSDIDSVVLDLHRLGCKRRVSKRTPNKGGLHSSLSEPRPESLDELEFHQLFGAGTFGRVWIVSKHGSKTAYALKIQSKRELLDQRQASSALRERAVMARLDHPFVCKLINSFQDEACIYMLQSLIQGGELLNLIQGGEMHGGLPEIATKFYAAGILEGLTYMHRRHIVYRDLKPENVLLDADGYPVIIDFGFCK